VPRHPISKQNTPPSQAQTHLDFDLPELLLQALPVRLQGADLLTKLLPLLLCVLQGAGLHLHYMVPSQQSSGIHTFFKEMLGNHNTVVHVVSA
jgi:hypothetical protein